MSEVLPEVSQRTSRLQSHWSQSATDPSITSITLPFFLFFWKVSGIFTTAYPHKSNYSQVLIPSQFWEHCHLDRVNWNHVCLVGRGNHQRKHLIHFRWEKKNGIKRESNFPISKISSVRCTGKVTTRVRSLNQVRWHYNVMNG